MWRRKAFDMPAKIYYSAAQMLQENEIVKLGHILRSQVKFLLKTRQSSFKRMALQLREELLRATTDSSKGGHYNKKY